VRAHVRRHIGVAAGDSIHEIEHVMARHDWPRSLV
jgi:hypothetical protein